MSINCVVADDEILARNVIKNYLAKLDYITLKAVCASGLDVYSALNRYPVDLLFLDIQMPNLTGIELLKTLKNPPAVIITTAYRDYAVESFELDVIDYLVKPISFDRFLKALNKYESRINPCNIGSVIPKPADHFDEADAFIYVKADRKMVKVLLRDLQYIEGLKDYVRIVTKDRSIVTNQTLTYLEEKLNPANFLRVHRSFIISVHQVEAFTATQVTIGAASVPIGKTFCKEVIRRLSAD